MTDIEITTTVRVRHYPPEKPAGAFAILRRPKGGDAKGESADPRADAPERPTKAADPGPAGGADHYDPAVQAKVMDTIAGLNRRPRVFLAVVRGRVAAELVRRGRTREAARRMAAEVDDQTIMDLAAAYGAAAPGDLGFVDWLLAHGPALARIVAAIVAVLSAFAEPAAA